MKALITKDGARRYNLKEGTLIEFNSINLAGCAINPTVHKDSKHHYGEPLPRSTISVKPFSKDKDCGAFLVQ